MLTPEELNTLRKDLEEIGIKAQEHFAASLEAAAEIALAHHDDPNIFKEDRNAHYINTHWSQYAPEELVVAGEKLGREIPPLLSRLVHFVRQAPLLSEADLADLRFLSKELMSALRYRQHKEWGPKVLRDEDSVLGIRPAGQDDSEWLSITIAQVTFQGSLHEVFRIIDFLVVQDQDLPAAIASTRDNTILRVKPKTAFIIMSMSRDLEDVKETIKDVFRKFGVTANRADDIEHQDVITERILNEIAVSEFLIADLTGERPSVYYEVGYAHAIGKRPILYRRAGSQLHFDLSVHNCPEYESLTDLRKKLTSRLSTITNRNPVE